MIIETLTKGDITNTDIITKNVTCYDKNNNKIIGVTCEKKYVANTLDVFTFGFGVFLIIIPFMIFYMHRKELLFALGEKNE